MTKPFNNSKVVLSLLAVLFMCEPARAQVRTVYGVRTSTTVVGHQTTVVAAYPIAPVLPAGYISVLPAGYRVVSVHGVRYYYEGGVHYRAEFYQGRTVYMRVNL